MGKAKDRVAGYLFTDDQGGVFRADVESGEIEKLAQYGRLFTDIAIAPNGDVYANTGTRFMGARLYRLDLEAETDAFVADLAPGIVANGLAFDGDGALYVSYALSSRIDVLTGKDFGSVDTIQLEASARSAGDMHVVGNTLYYADAAETLRTIDLKTGAETANAFHGLDDLYGLHRFKGRIYGLSVREVHEIDPKTGASRKAADLPIIGQVNGAATAPDGLVQGAKGADVIVGLFAGAEVRGGRGNDKLFAPEGGARLLGQAGRDRLEGDRGNDRLEGGGGNDRMDGGRGRDRLEGDGGNDRMEGGRGNDRLEGGRGNDRMEGDGGRDVFAFSRKDGKDKVLDWQDGRDRIEFESGPRRFGDLNIRQKGDDVTIDYRRDGGKIVFDDADADDFGRSDFLFG